MQHPVHRTGGRAMSAGWGEVWPRCGGWSGEGVEGLTVTVVIDTLGWVCHRWGGLWARFSGRPVGAWGSDMTAPAVGCSSWSPATTADPNAPAQCFPRQKAISVSHHPTRVAGMASPGPQYLVAWGIATDVVWGDASWCDVAALHDASPGGCSCGDPGPDRGRGPGAGGGDPVGGPDAGCGGGPGRVGVRTVLRHFGSRDGLLDAVFAAGRAEVEAERLAPRGDVDVALTVLVAHYERRGDFVMHLLAQEGTEPRIDVLLSGGRELHRRWVSGVFGPWLLGPGAESLVDLLVVATDVYAWKLLRRDRGLSAADTATRLRRLVDAVLAHHGKQDDHV